METSSVLGKQSLTKQEKIREVEDCLSQNEVNLWHLRELCLMRGGLMTAELRRQAWHLLLGVDADNHIVTSSSVNTTATQSEETKRVEDSDIENSFTDDTELISRDVGRAVYFRYSMTEAAKEQLTSQGTEDYIQSGKTMLTRLIVSTIENEADNGQDGRLNYYQGFHDVASVIFVNMTRETELACAILHKLAASHLRDAMMQDFTNISALLEIVFYPLLQAVDEELHDYLILRELIPSVFLTWMITLFSHDIHSEQTASRLFDAIIVSHPLLPLYLTIAILIQPKNRQKLFNANRSEAAMMQVVATSLLAGMEYDFQSTHDGFTAQDVIECALGVMTKVPPDLLLNLAQHYDLGQNQILMTRCQSMNLFKPPKQWAISSTYDKAQNVLNLNSTNEDFDVCVKYPLAYAAIGVSSKLKSHDSIKNKRFKLKKIPKLLRGAIQSKTISAS